MWNCLWNHLCFSFRWALWHAEKDEKQSLCEVAYEGLVLNLPATNSFEWSYLFFDYTWPYWFQSKRAGGDENTWITQQPQVVPLALKSWHSISKFQNIWDITDWGQIRCSSNNQWLSCRRRSVHTTQAGRRKGRTWNSPTYGFLRKV